MNMQQDDSLPATLDPPGTIAVVGTTHVGIETALYGRYLGYDVKLLAGADTWAPRSSQATSLHRIGPTFSGDWFARHWLGEQSIDERWSDPIPMMPDRCLSPLALSAIAAQREDVPAALPVTMQEWIESGLQSLVETDLLRGRVHANTFVDSIELAAVLEDDEPSEDEEDDGDIPPDFLLKLRGEAIGDDESNELRCECVIIADLPPECCRLEFDPPAEYFYRISSADHADAAEELRAGWQQIARIYAELAGRSDLDLYRPLRV
ncbi:hypothetical protein [Aporhodopirellula aestuarii]|uniref:Uncharacterized protein n=1 Tax=Aporhodopirellula aestuarii TaxID=2950107 RepID=A0ABT0U0X3_9BACT|nr:hypothetical protein [Aporhodopirellula aestuarii]MCM2370505.1 hypothetical protein [Aporhodopirellula aestuarii]